MLSMNSIPFLTLLTALLTLAAVARCPAASFFDLFKRKPATNETGSATLSTLSQDQITAGLKEALDKGVQQAIASLGKSGGFLNDLSVKIPMPASLQKVETTLRALRQDKLADEFIATMNNAAEQAVPQAATVLGDSIKQMSIADAKSILTGTNNAATRYFRRTSETNLHARFLPIVKTATEKAGVTSSYKQMVEKAGTAFGGVAGGLFNKQATDLDDYVTRKALDGLFVKIADQEKQIRENPVARTTDLLQKVFGAVNK